MHAQKVKYSPRNFSKNTTSLLKLGTVKPKLFLFIKRTVKSNVVLCVGKPCCFAIRLTSWSLVPQELDIPNHKVQPLVLHLPQVLRWFLTAISSSCHSYPVNCFV